MAGLPRFLATACLEDPARIVSLADGLISPDANGPVVLLQVGKTSAAAVEVARELQKTGRRSVPLVIRDREAAQADHTLSRLVCASAVWVFADDMLEAFMTLYATDVAFALRARARAG
jgi:cyanophycinase-like exopeptidase